MNVIYLFRYFFKKYASNLDFHLGFTIDNVIDDRKSSFDQAYKT